MNQFHKTQIYLIEEEKQICMRHTNYLNLIRLFRHTSYFHEKSHFPFI